MRPRRVLLGVAAALGVVLVVGCAPTPVTKYDVAKKLQRHRKFASAIKEYEQFISQNKDSVLVPYALYNIAWCYRGLYKKQEALDAYKKVIDQYPASDPAAWARTEMDRLKKMELKPPPPPKKKVKKVEKKKTKKAKKKK